jgi:heat shock protein HtpX
MTANNSTSPSEWRDVLHKIKAILYRRLLDPWANMSGQTKVWMIMALLTATLMISGFWLAGRFGLLAAFILGLAINIIVFVYTESRLVRLFRYQEWEGQDPWGLRSDIKRLSEIIGMRTPRTLVANLSTPIIYSCGVFPVQMRLVISSGLLDHLDHEERRAVLGYELLRIHKKMTSATTAASALASCFETLGHLLDHTIFLPITLITQRRGRHARREPLRLGLAIFAPIIGLINRVTVSRRQIFKTDLNAAELLSKSSDGDFNHGRQSLAEALYKLDAYAQTRPVKVRLCDSSVFVVNPLTEFQVSSYFLVQPPLKARIRQLIGRSTP